MLRKLAYTAAISSALWLSTATALGLGDIEVKSQLNQKFSGVIALTSTTVEEAEGLIVSLASNEDFARAGIDRSEYVTTLIFEVKITDGQPRIEVSSKQLAREPYVAFLIDVRGIRNRLLREYTVLLDPPDASALKPAPAVTGTGAQFYETADEATVQPPAPAASVEVERPAPAPAPAADTPGTPALAADGSYGPVQHRETLWSIASKLRADASVSMDQSLLAVYTANRSAFVGGINGLSKGAMLRVPTAEEQRAVSASAARARVAELRGVVASPPAPPPTAVAAVEEPAAAPPPRPEPPPPKPVAKPQPAPEPAPTPPPPVEKKNELSKPAPAPVVPPTPAPAPAEASAVPTPDTVAPASAPAETPPAESTAPTEAPPAPSETTPATEPAAEPPPTSATPPQPPVPAAATIEPEDSSGGLPLPLILGGLILVLGAAAGGAWYYRKRQQAEFSPPLPPSNFESRSLEPAPRVTVARTAPGSSVRDELEQLEDTFKQEVSDLGATAPPSRLENTLAMTAQMPAPASMRMDPNSTQVIEPGAASTVRMTEKVDFDVTGQFESDTVSINLDTNDPVAEADFHLAYGLYDEAALLLIQAAEKDPANTAVRGKLAEVYFAAGKAAEFQQTAEGLKAELPPAEWQKLAILGQQLCPDAAIFQDLGDGDIGGVVDLSFDEPAAPEPLELPGIGAPDMASTAAHAPPAAPGGGVLDFKLEDFQLPSATPAKAPAKVEPHGGGAALEFNLDVPEIKVAPPTETKLELDLADFDLSAPADASAPTGVKSQIVEGELHLEDFDVAADSADISSGDAAGTKLDLARVYLDMGDKDMAKSLLDEVMQQGSAQQKQEAQALIGRLG